MQHRDKLVQTMWRVLKVRDAIPSDRTIRAVLARSDAADEIYCCDLAIVCLISAPQLEHS